jgi:D-3-phosphoglycerate dehydrogenase
MKYLITEWMPNGIELLREHGDVVYDTTLWNDRPRLFDALSDCDALIVRNQTQVDAKLLGASPRLKVVGRLGVGLDNLDLNALRERNVIVVTGGNANAVSVAEYAMAAMMVLSRKLVAADASTKSGMWARATFGAGAELFGKTLGLIGLGDIGARVAKRAVAFGMKVIAHDPLITPTHFASAEFDVGLVSLDEVLRCSDFISLHVPLIPSTKHLIDHNRISQMKPTAILINSSRGGIVDEVALASALSEKRIGGAALDVREKEPPDSNDALARFENVLLTPHIGGLTVEAQARVCVSVAQDVLRVLRGEKPMFAVR